MIIDTLLDQIICGDCMEWLPKMPSGSVDIINTDPPYNLGKDYGPDFNDNKTPRKYWNWFKDVFAECYRLLSARRGGYLYMSHSDRNIWIAKSILDRLGFNYIQTLVWHRRNGMSLKNTKNNWSYRHELILLVRKGNPAHFMDGIGKSFTSVIEAATPQTNYRGSRYHPCQKPVRLYDIILARTPGDIVLDPFMGSGTTARAAIKNKKHYIGFEINPVFHSNAVKLTNIKLPLFDQPMHQVCIKGIDVQ